MLVILNNFANFRFLELGRKVYHSKYMTWILDEFQEVLSTNPWIIDSKKFTGPDPSEWRELASVAYFKDKLYYLGGWEPGTSNRTNRVNVRRLNENP